MKQRLYVFNNTILKRKNNTLFFEQIIDEENDFEHYMENFDEYLLENAELPETECGKYMPVENVEAIFSIGTVHFHTQFINFLGKNKIPLHIFGYNGNYTGSFIPAERILSGASLVAQAKHYLEYDKRIYIAKQFVDAAAHNTLCNLKYHNNRNAELSDFIEYIEEVKKEINTAQNIEELMGLEGMIKRAYYEAWTEIFIYPVDFYKRVKHPPNNLINSLISYGNMIVYGTCINEIYQTRLYPEISYLHEPSEARLSLSFDIAEMFKPLLTDRIIFKVINKNMITENDAVTKNGFCKLNKNAKQIFTQEFENKLTTKIKIEGIEKRVSYKRLIREECYKLLKHIKNEEIYKAYKSKW